MTKRPFNPKKIKRPSGCAGRVAFAALVSLAVLALLFFLLVRGQGQISLPENAVGSILAPIQNVVSTATIFVRDQVNGVRDFLQMQKDLENANMELAELKMQVVDMTEAKLENERLKALLDAKQQYESMSPVYARVIARAPGVWFNTFSINRGRMDGVSVDMAVVTGDGLVGSVYEVGETYAKVMTMIDPRKSVACLVERTRNSGIVYGQNMQDMDVAECQMRFVRAVNDVSPGDAVITSGEDQFYPKGIMVGRVTQISRQQADNPDRFILVQPSVDFQSIEEVLVLRTLIERDSEQLAPLLTPTPRPTPIATPTPVPTPDANISTGLDEEFEYPDEGMLDESGQLIESTTRAPIIDTEGTQILPEDEWAQ